MRYAGIVRDHVTPVWGDVRLSAVTHADVATWVQAMLAEGQSASSVRATYGVLRRVLDHAVRDGRLQRNPAASVRLPRLRRRREKRYLSHAEVADLVRGSGSYAPLIRTPAYTGLRWSETKTHRVRVIPFPASLSPELRCGHRRRGTRRPRLPPPVARPSATATPAATSSTRPQHAQGWLA